MTDPVSKSHARKYILKMGHLQIPALHIQTSKLLIDAQIQLSPNYLAAVTWYWLDVEHGADCYLCVQKILTNNIAFN